jgi:hypothetical protein
MAPTRAAEIGSLPSSRSCTRARPRRCVVAERLRDDQHGDRLSEDEAVVRVAVGLDGVGGRKYPLCPIAATSRRDVSVCARSRTAHGTWRGVFETTPPKSSTMMTGWISIIAITAGSFRSTRVFLEADGEDVRPETAAHARASIERAGERDQDDAADDDEEQLGPERGRSLAAQVDGAAHSM